MFLENIDAIIIGTSAILILVSIVVNIVSTSKLSQLSESLSYLEKNFEAAEAAKSRIGGSPARENQPPDWDSSILPAADPALKETRTGTRYRPPGTRIDLKPVGKREPEKDSQTSDSPAPKVSASDSEPQVYTGSPGNTETKGDDLMATALVSGPIIGQNPTPKEKESTPLPPTSEDEQEMLKSYLGSTSPFLKEEETKKEEKKQESPSDEELITGTAKEPENDISPETSEKPASDASALGHDLIPNFEGEEDVMDVIEDATAVEEEEAKPEEIKKPEPVSKEPAPEPVKAAPKKTGAEPMEINPFNPSQQKVNFDLVKSLLKQIEPETDFILDFSDTLFLVKNEIKRLGEIEKAAGKKGVRLALKNVANDLRIEIMAKMPDTVFL